MAAEFLFWRIIFTTFIYSLIPAFIKVTLQILFYKEPEGIKSLKKELIDLKSEVLKINMVNNFAQYAKLQRKIRKCTKDLADIYSQRNALMAQLKIVSTALLHAFVGSYVFFLLWNHYKDPVIMLPPEWLYPIDKILSFPLDNPGAIGLTVWLVITSSVAKTVVNQLVYNKTT